MIKVLFSNTSALAKSDSARLSIALLTLRVVVGLAFMAHGFGKIQAPFSWMPPESPVPGIFQALAALAEFGGGFALILGLLIPLVSLGLMSTMTVAMFVQISRGDPFFGGYELAMVYFVIALFFLLAGPGRFSADKVILEKIK